ncbi:2,5-didehydrogluconate reductase [Camelimonas fluminis]|uniref:Aldo/keto reductase n=1 Tax=Camelimonas fluminis TaxID=1576911 RepID=A0ABV7UGF2_9HYPH|nr:aldo/keto reductase [Camelimonas fluminis]GHE49514.1 2,5-didehydrogluconate reductase [Camelimonas fluminis]
MTTPPESRIDNGQIVVHANGAAIPAIALGTWQSTDDACARAVGEALRSGYRHIDTAAAYGNEAQVAEGIRASGVARDQFFVTTKVWRENMARDAVLRSAADSVRRLDSGPVDLLLLHWPTPDAPLADSIAGLVAAKREGLTRHIGVSNFTIPLIDEAVRLSEEPLVTNQVEYHPLLNQGRLIRACAAHGLSLTAYSPLGRGALLADPAIIAIADAHGREPAQIVLRWLIQQPGVIAAPKSVTPQRIRNNLAVFDFELGDIEMARIGNLARPDGRLINPAFAPEWD